MGLGAWRLRVRPVPFAAPRSVRAGVVALAALVVSHPVAGVAAEPLVVAAASSVWWYPNCHGSVEECSDSERRLDYADDDVWRATFLLASQLEPRSYRILVTPDDATRARTFAADPAGPATAAELIRAVGELRRANDGPRDVVVYLAAHGSEGEVHLEDGRHEFATLRKQIEAELGPDDHLLLVADVCWSGTWRGIRELTVTDDAAVFPPVQRSVGTALEAVVEGRTPEDGILGGGYFSYLVLSGLMGGADSDGDGAVGALELSDFVHGYTAADGRLAPAIRVPGGDPSRVVAVPRAATALRFGPEATPARWLVLHGDGTLLMEAFVPAGGERALRAPPGRYRVLRVPVVRDGAFYRVVSTKATAWGISVTEGGSNRPEGPGEEVTLDRSTTFRDGRIGVGIGLPGISIATPSADASRYHDAPRGTVGLGLVAHAPLDVGAVVGPSISYARSLPGGRARLAAAVAVASRPGGEPWPLAVSLDPVGIEVDLVHRRHAALAVGLTSRVEALQLQWARVTAATVGIGGGAGMSARWWPGNRLALDAGVEWAPVAWMRETHTATRTGVRSGVGWIPEIDAVRAGVEIQWRP